MKALTAGDLMAVAEYERGREAFRARIIELKRRRRISVGPLRSEEHTSELQSH